MLASGFIGVSITGAFLDKTNAYKKLLIFLVMISFAFFGLLLHQFLGACSYGMIIFYMVILGMAMISVLPASIGLGVEITFPMQPALVSGVMMMFAQISGCLQSVVYSAIMDVDANDY